MIRPETAQEELIVRLGTNPRLAHEALFGHRHTNETPPFHYDMIDDLHSATPRIAQWAFRNAAKTTRAEEAAGFIVLLADAAIIFVRTC